jgi:hypothetical protein
MIETFILLSALGGENVDDVQHIRDDAGLVGIVGYTLPAPETARQWLDSFHDETLMLNRYPRASSWFFKNSGFA